MEEFSMEDDFDDFDLEEIIKFLDEILEELAGGY